MQNLPLASLITKISELELSEPVAGPRAWQPSSHMHYHRCSAAEEQPPAPCHTGGPLYLLLSPSSILCSPSSSSPPSSLLPFPLVLFTEFVCLFHSASAVSFIPPILLPLSIFSSRQLRHPPAPLPTYNPVPPCSSSVLDIVLPLFSLQTSLLAKCTICI